MEQLTYEDPLADFILPEEMDLLGIPGTLYPTEHAVTINMAQDTDDACRLTSPVEEKFEVAKTLGQLCDNCIEHTKVSAQEATECLNKHGNGIWPSSLTLRTSSKRGKCPGCQSVTLSTTATSTTTLRYCNNWTPGYVSQLLTARKRNIFKLSSKLLELGAIPSTYVPDRHVTRAQCLTREIRDLSTKFTHPVQASVHPGFSTMIRLSTIEHWLLAAIHDATFPLRRWFDMSESGTLAKYLNAPTPDIYPKPIAESFITSTSVLGIDIVRPPRLQKRTLVILRDYVIGNQETMFRWEMKYELLSAIKDPYLRKELLTSPTQVLVTELTKVAFDDYDIFEFFTASRNREGQVCYNCPVCKRSISMQNARTFEHTQCSLVRFLVHHFYLIWKEGRIILKGTIPLDPASQARAETLYNVAFPRTVQAGDSNLTFSSERLQIRPSKIRDHEDEERKRQEKADRAAAARQTNR